MTRTRRERRTRREPVLLFVTRAAPSWRCGAVKAAARAGMAARFAHDCWSAERLADTCRVEAIAIDARVLCGNVDVRHPGPILSRAGPAPVVVYASENLGPALRDVALAHGATLVESDGPDAVVQAVLGGDPGAGRRQGNCSPRRPAWGSRAEGWR